MLLNALRFVMTMFSVDKMEELTINVDNTESDVIGRESSRKCTEFAVPMSARKIARDIIETFFP